MANTEKFLNSSGLSSLWAKIKSKFYTKAEVDAAITGITTNLSDLTDTSISTPQSNQALIFHERSGKWVNMDIPYHSVTTLTDTGVSNPTDGQVLQYDATNEAWVNTTLNTGATYSLSMSNNIITLTGSDSSTSSATLPVFGGTSADVWEGGVY